LALPLVTPFTTSFSTQTERRVLVTELTALVDGQEVTGWSECGALSEPVYSEEYTEGVIDVTARHLLPRLVAAGAVGPLTAETVAEHLEKVVGHRMAKAALETAVLDAQLRAAGVSFKDYLGVTRDRVPSGVSVGIQGSIPQLLDTVAGYLDEGYQRIKLKIQPGWDIEPVRAVREAYPHVPLQVDANAAYTLVDAAHLSRLDAFDLLLIEQPLGEDDMRQHAELAKRMSTPMCLDESVVSATAAADAIQMGAAQVINIKPSRVGGYLEARRIHDISRAHGVAVWCGGMLETGIGRAANAALAGLPGFTLTGDISASGRFYKEDITEPFELVDGHIKIPDAPGLAAVPDPERLAAATVASVDLPV
jgi:O-succinylbenzoate synthase